MAKLISTGLLLAFTLVCNMAAAQATNSRTQNLNTCLSGKYPILCNRALLGPEDLKRVDLAEKRENLKTCLTGKYKALCNKALLSPEEMNRTIEAERQENLKVCTTGRYPVLCDKTLLSNQELARTEQAENAESKKQPPKHSRSNGRYPRGGGGDCESGHWIDSVTDDGEIIKLEDGSVWEVDSVDTVDSALWLPTTEIVACEDKLINTDDGEKVHATRIR